ncbi:MAG: hypothetical protein A2252_10775 [Elusimicrobia bacterium RIFOXYA2_FULL_39_19]|nr:MAG: hypothetical protein A2252_10775 [Elusimicrobia bacterium RIFOXYA2_FULL_39_19]
MHDNYHESQKPLKNNQPVETISLDNIVLKKRPTLRKIMMRKIRRKKVMGFSGLSWIMLLIILAGSIGAGALITYITDNAIKEKDKKPGPSGGAPNMEEMKQRMMSRQQ